LPVLEGAIHPGSTPIVVPASQGIEVVLPSLVGPFSCLADGNGEFLLTSDIGIVLATYRILPFLVAGIFRAHTPGATIYIVSDQCRRKRHGLLQCLARAGCHEGHYPYKRLTGSGLGGAFIPKSIQHLLCDGAGNNALAQQRSGDCCSALLRGRRRYKVINQG